MPRIVVLGTGTGVGKTFVSVALARALAARGEQVSALKPIETGCDPDALDALTLERASTLRAPTPHPLVSMRPPISPHLAARQLGIRLNPADVLRWLDAIPISSHMACWQIVETAGGTLSPLGTALTNLDLARALEPALLLLVAPDALGVLHDVSATRIAMEHLHRPPDYLVLSAARPADASTGSNAAELSKLGIFEPIASLRDDPVREIEPLVERLLAVS